MPPGSDSAHEHARIARDEKRPIRNGPQAITLAVLRSSRIMCTVTKRPLMARTEHPHQHPAPPEGGRDDKNEANGAARQSPDGTCRSLVGETEFVTAGAETSRHRILRRRSAVLNAGEDTPDGRGDQAFQKVFVQTQSLQFKLNFQSDTSKIKTPGFENRGLRATPVCREHRQGTPETMLRRP